MGKLKTSVAKSLAEAFIHDKKNSNNLVKLLGFLENEEDIPACLIALDRIFCHLIENEAMCSNVKPGGKDESSKEEKYTDWLKEMYADTKCKLIDLLLHPNVNIQQLSLATLMKLVKAEGHKPFNKDDTSLVLFPSGFFGDIMRQVFSNDHDTSLLLGQFQEFMEYDDVRYYAMKTTLKYLNKVQCNKAEGFYISNVFSLLDILSMPVTPPKDYFLTNFLSKSPETVKGIAVNSYSKHKKLFSELWLLFLRDKMPVTSVSLYKKVLVILHEKVIPCLENPLLLSDFLTTSYSVGGAISLLALNGVFILINKYNLDYPDFYKKLYGLLEPSVLHVKYKARFFYLLDLFLTSTHLPAYLVAAFVKRMARLTLTAPPSGLTVLIPLIFNLLIRHPSCKGLLHCTTSQTMDISDDPFDNEELDPSKCCALESSLWEIRTLEHHYFHAVSKEAKKGSQSLPRMETDISDFLETTTDSMIQLVKKQKVSEVSTTFEPPTGLFGNKEDQLNQGWVWTLS